MRHANMWIIQINFECRDSTHLPQHLTIDNIQIWRDCPIRNGYLKENKITNLQFQMIEFPCYTCWMLGIPFDMLIVAPTFSKIADRGCQHVVSLLLCRLYTRAHRELSTPIQSDCWYFYLWWSSRVSAIHVNTRKHYFCFVSLRPISYLFKRDKSRVKVLIVFQWLSFHLLRNNCWL